MMSELYLSQIFLCKSEMLKRRLYSPYAFHKLMWTCFPGHPDASRDFLFRADESENGCKILLLSANQPVRGEWGEWAGIKKLNLEFSPGQTFWFKLRANPVKREKNSGKLLSVTGKDALQNWLINKGKQSGFSLRAEPEFSSRAMRFSKMPGTPVITLNVAEMEGVLAVENSCLFDKAFRQGIGRGRAFGCGMLLLKPIQKN